MYLNQLNYIQYIFGISNDNFITEKCKEEIMEIMILIFQL